MNNKISQKEYYNYFRGKLKQSNALQSALDIRKFEIDLYWKRATYFWAFIAATFAAYGAIQASSISNKSDFSVLLSCLGIVFSVGWYYVNRGSKQWQENWENHVDMLEDKIMGPLYKVVLMRPKPKGFKQKLSHYVTGPSQFSVSKINQIISLYMIMLWIFILYKSLPLLSFEASINWEYVIIIFITILTCFGFIILGKTHLGGYTHLANKRNTEIDPEF